MMQAAAAGMVSVSAPALAVRARHGTQAEHTARNRATAP
ncbi:hypothetical protein BURMUCF2_A0524 [Burkholderia multivorans CF2]|nr:hypothetical protein BURMUCF2_A0524 [Burkholderia multivorans CF2]